MKSKPLYKATLERGSGSSYHLSKLVGVITAIVGHNEYRVRDRLTEQEAQELAAHGDYEVTTVPRK